MIIPIQILENLGLTLPDAETFEGTSFLKEFTYEKHFLALRFFIVSDIPDSGKFWMHNKENVQTVFKNGEFKER